MNHANNRNRGEGDGGALLAIVIIVIVIMAAIGSGTGGGGAKSGQSTSAPPSATRTDIAQVPAERAVSTQTTPATVQAEPDPPPADTVNAAEFAQAQGDTLEENTTQLREVIAGIDEIVDMSVKTKKQLLGLKLRPNQETSSSPDVKASQRGAAPQLHTNEAN